MCVCVCVALAVMMGSGHGEQDGDDDDAVDNEEEVKTTVMTMLQCIRHITGLRSDVALLGKSAQRRGLTLSMSRAAEFATRWHAW